MVEVPIATVYLERHASSHFRPLIDSLKVLTPLVLFAGSSLIAFGIDTGALLVLSALTGSLAASVAGARLLSGSVNFAINRRAVFRSKGKVGPQVVRYGAFAAVLVALGVAGIAALTSLGVPLVVAKITTDATLRLTSFGVQRVFVFAHGSAAVGPQPEADLQRVGGGSAG